MNTELRNFYIGSGTDKQGRLIQEIWSWSARNLEESQNYIQWLFPLTEPSLHYPDAPLLDDETIEAFLAEKYLKQNLNISFELMMSFYHFDRENPDELHWVNPGNHNYLRLTRILTSLNLLGAKDQSRTMYEKLIQISAKHPGEIGSVTLQYWEAALM